MTTALLMDKYELTMVEAALASGTAARRCVFEVFARRLPAGRRYGVVAGTGRLAEMLADFRFDDSDIAWLLESGVVSQPTADFLADYSFTGTITGYAEGECYFPGSPVLTVTGTFAEAVVLETLVLSVLNHDSAIASAASRMCIAAAGRPCLEMGARRTHERAAVAAARAAFVAGFGGTSMLEAGRRWDIPTIGTAAHAFTLLNDNEQQAFRSQIASQGIDTTLLVDTYDITAAVARAIEVAGPELSAVRIDSGDLPVLAKEVRAQLDSLGAHRTKIVVTSDLDEFSIATLAVAPVDSYGVGTALVTGSGAPTAEMVYKLVARENQAGELEPVAKKSGSKSTVGGAKYAARRLDERGVATEEIVALDGLAPQGEHAGPGSMRPLQIDYVRDGVILAENTGRVGLERAVVRHRESLAELPRAARRLSHGEPALPTVQVRGRA